MALELPIAVYGNADLYRELFNAIAAALGDTVYGSLTKLAILLTATWAGVRYSIERSFRPLLIWLVSYYVAFFVMFTPKATIEIMDMVNQGKAYTVDNVPLGLAIVASWTSSLGAGLTDLTEKNFSMPDDVSYQKTGMVMASRLVLASTQFQVTDPNFSDSLQSFVHQCIFYDLLLNKYSWKDLLNTTNIWQFVTQNASPARAFVYYQPGGNSQVVTCQTGVSMLSKDWQDAVQEAAARYGARLFPEADDAKTQLLSYLGSDYSFLTDISDSAANLLQQNMMANAIQNGILTMGTTTNAPAALEAFAFTKAQQQKRLTNQTVGDMAVYWLPIMKNVLEATLYGSFIFIFLLLMFPFGGSIFKYYVASLLWIQLWAPLYAILNLFMNVYAQHHNLGAINLGNGQTGLVLSTQGGLAQVNADVASLAGYLSLSIPLIATGLVRGMMSVFSTAAQYIAGVTQGTATASAGEAISGNLSLGNTNFSNHSSFNTSANHFDTNARVFGGMYTTQLPGGSTLSMSPDGSLIMNNQPAISNLGTSINLAYAIRTAATQQADSSYSAALNYANAYTDSVSTGLRSMYELGNHIGTSETSGSGYSVTVTGGVATALNNVHQLTERFAYDHNISVATATRYLAAAYASGKAGASAFGVLGGDIGGKLEADKSHSHENRELYAAAQEYLHNTNFSQSVDVAVRGMQEHSYRTTSEDGQRLIDNIGSSFDQASQVRHEVMSNLQQSQSYREMASYAEENATSINSNATQSFMNWMEKQPGTQHSGSIENMMVNDPQMAQQYAQEYTKQQVQSYMNEFHKGKDSSASDISTTYQENNKQIPSDVSVSTMNEANRKVIADEATKKGLSQTPVSKQAISDANALISGSEYAVTTGKEVLSQQGEAIQQETKEKMDN